MTVTSIKTINKIVVVLNYDLLAASACKSGDGATNNLLAYLDA